MFSYISKDGVPPLVGGGETKFMAPTILGRGSFASPVLV
jgi:hypothetical protein